MILSANPSAQYRAHKTAVRKAIDRVLEGSIYILGPEVTNFERSFAEYCGVMHAVGVASGTDALTLTLRALEIGVGDEVITVSHTALATVAAVIASGATPVLVDIDPLHYTIDPAAIERALTKRTKAVIAVHLYGQAADLDAIRKVTKHHKLKLIEDCAQSTGGLYKGERLGSLGDVGTFSFFPTKNLGAIGDGGAVITNNTKLAERIARIRQYGWNAKRVTSEVGVNSRLDSIQAAILGAKLPGLDGDNERRIRLATYYDKGLRGLPVSAPAVRPECRHVFHLYVVACKDRDALRRRLMNDGIGVDIHYPVPAHKQDGYTERVRLPKAGLPVTERVVEEILTLPLYPELKRAVADQVIASIRSHYAG